MRKIGFSSGAIAHGDFLGALATLRGSRFPCLELSALRVVELPRLVAALPQIDLSAYSYVSFHAPSAFSRQDEAWIAEMLYVRVPEVWPIILHPDAICDFKHWERFGKRLAIENMDRRKPVGRTACELNGIFAQLPGASLCFDVGHARQCDPSMTEAFLILSTFAQRLVQVHISEVNSASQHDSISRGAQLAFQQIAHMIPESIPVIIESRVSQAQICAEAERAIDALTPRRKDAEPRKASPMEAAFQARQTPVRWPSMLTGGTPMFGLGQKETDAEKQAEKDAKQLANQLADQTPADEQADLYAESPQLGTFGAIPSSDGAEGSFVDRK
jgi:hypothetical protein